MKIHSEPTLERAHSLISNHSGVVFKPDITTLIANRMQQHWILLDGLIPSMRWLLWGKLTGCISPRVRKNMHVSIKTLQNVSLWVDGRGWLTCSLCCTEYRAILDDWSDKTCSFCRGPWNYDYVCETCSERFCLLCHLRHNYTPRFSLHVINSARKRTGTKQVGFSDETWRGTLDSLWNSVEC